MFELRTHDLGTADGPVKHCLVQDAPHLRRARPFQDRLPVHPGGHLLAQLVLVGSWLGGEDRVSVVLGLQPQGDAFWWSWEERISGTDDLATAASTLVRVLRTVDGEY